MDGGLTLGLEEGKANLFPSLDAKNEMSESGSERDSVYFGTLRNLHVQPGKSNGEGDSEQDKVDQLLPLIPKHELQNCEEDKSGDFPAKEISDSPSQCRVQGPPETVLTVEEFPKRRVGSALAFRRGCKRCKSLADEAPKEVKVFPDVKSNWEPQFTGGWLME